MCNAVLPNVDSNLDLSGHLHRWVDKQWIHKLPPLDKQNSKCFLSSFPIEWWISSPSIKEEENREIRFVLELVFLTRLIDFIIEKCTKLYVRKTFISHDWCKRVWKERNKTKSPPPGNSKIFVKKHYKKLVHFYNLMVIFFFYTFASISF